MSGQIPNRAPCLAVFGTGSDVGKSVVATAVCRHFANQGVRVAPFKAQNMSNNSGVTPEGLEMGRAQIVQAEAAKIVPHVDMNPILLKPTSDVGAQVVVLGRAVENATAAGYHEKKEALFETAAAALDRLRREFDLVVMEGAGSCAEVNLMANDIVNFKIAETADAPVILVADIHRGGVFGQIIGTLACLSAGQRQRIAGSLVNRFRGDLSLFEDGVRWIEEKTGKPVFGVLPWYSDIRIDAEDSVVIERPRNPAPDKINPPAVGVIRIPHISNFTDFDALEAVPGLSLHYIETPREIDGLAAVVLPGSKNTRHDLAWLFSTGWSGQLRAYQKRGGHILGVCGGYQMMGNSVQDPKGVEGAPGESPGLGLLPVVTVLKAPKTTSLTRFAWGRARGGGYEIHMGQTRRAGGRPLFELLSQNGVACKGTEGCTTGDGGCMGTYIHGLFDTPAILKQWLAMIGLEGLAVPDALGLAARNKEYDRLAEHFARHVDTVKIERLTGLQQESTIG